MTEPRFPDKSVNTAGSSISRGLALRQLSEMATLILSPAGRAYEVALPVPEVRELLSTWADGAQIADPERAQVVETLQSAGLLTTDLSGNVDAERHWSRFTPVPDSPRWTATIVGSPLLCDIAEAVTSAMPGARTSRAGIDSGDRKGTLLALLDYPDAELLRSLNVECRDAKRPFAPFWLDGGSCWMGPVIFPGRTEDISDVLDRLLTACDREDVIRARWQPPVSGADVRPAVSELYWAIGYFLVQIERWFAGVPCDLVGSVAVADPLRFSLEHHPVLPMPDKVPAGYPRRHPAEIADPVTGVVIEIRDIEHDPSVPASLHTVQAGVADMSRLYPWANNTVCQGSAFADYASARGAAIGESAERYCANWVDASLLRRDSLDGLRRSGECAVDPADLILYSDEQYAAPGFPFVPFEPSTVVHWVQGRSVTRDCPIWVPASMVYVNWYTGEYADDPHTNFLYYPGIAAGRTVENAIVSGLEEVIERDATVIWWMNRQALPSLILPTDLADLWKGIPTELGQLPSAIQLDNEFGIPVVAGVLANHRDQLLNIGFAARPTVADAARKAWTEALTLQEGSRDLRIPDGLLWTAVAEGRFNGVALKPWRADDAYMQDYRADYHDINDLMCQQQFYLDPRAQGKLADWCRTKPERPLDRVGELADRSLAALRSAVEVRGYDIVYVDVTTADIRSVGLNVVRVIVPGLVPNAPAAFPFLGRRRVQDQAVSLGWRGEALEERQLNFAPIPHA